MFFWKKKKKNYYHKIMNFLESNSYEASGLSQGKEVAQPPGSGAGGFPRSPPPLAFALPNIFQDHIVWTERMFSLGVALAETEFYSDFLASAKVFIASEKSNFQLDSNG